MKFWRDWKRRRDTRVAKAVRSELADELSARIDALAASSETNLKKELERQRKRLQHSIRSAAEKQSVAARPSAWFINSRRPDLPLPRTVVDVGVGRGTVDLYRAYPRAFHLLVEPLEEFKDPIKSILQSYEGIWVKTAASNTSGPRALHVNRTTPTNSTFAQPTPDLGNECIERRVVQTARLDHLIGERKLPGPFAIKTDTEGHDLEALEGAGDLLKETIFVIAECRLDSRFGRANLNEIVKFLHGRSFNIADILEIKWEKDDGRLRWANIAFVNDGYSGG